MNNKFSILTASYNNASYLDDWANSILVQEYRPLEVIFVNDRSTDKTLEKINKLVPLFKEKNIEIKVVSNKRRKFCGTSYEIARTSASGGFFGVLDSDDALVEDAVKYIMNVYKEHTDVVYLYTQFQICDHKLRFIKKGFCSVPGGKYGSLLGMGIRGIHGFSHWRTFSSRCPGLNKIFKQGLTCSVDKYMGYMLEESGLGGFVNRICYNYRKGVKNSITRVNNTRHIWLKIIREIRDRRRIKRIKPYRIKIIERV